MKGQLPKRSSIKKQGMWHEKKRNLVTPPTGLRKTIRRFILCRHQMQHSACPRHHQCKIYQKSNRAYHLFKMGHQSHFCGMFNFGILNKKRKKMERHIFWTVSLVCLSECSIMPHTQKKVQNLLTEPEPYPVSFTKLIMTEDLPACTHRVGLASLSLPMLWFILFCGWKWGSRLSKGYTFALALRLGDSAPWDVSWMDWFVGQSWSGLCVILKAQRRSILRFSVAIMGANSPCLCFKEEIIPQQSIFFLFGFWDDRKKNCSMNFIHQFCETLFGCGECTKQNKSFSLLSCSINIILLHTDTNIRSGKSIISGRLLFTKSSLSVKMIRALE